MLHYGMEPHRELDMGTKVRVRVRISRVRIRLKVLIGGSIWVQLSSLRFVRVRDTKACVRH